MKSKEYQNYIFSLLQVKLGRIEIVNEWIAFTGHNNQYSPRVDIAVGPFATVQCLIEEYDELMIQSDMRFFLQNLYDLHRENIRNEITEIEIPNFNNLLCKNKNSRCLLAFEIENKNSRKHIMGSIINAASLGRVGIGIAYDENTLRTFIRILNYLDFLKRVEKNTYDTTNFLVITKEQMLTLLNNNHGN